MLPTLSGYPIGFAPNILDATYYKVCIDGAVRDCATLKAIGIRRDDGKRMNCGSVKFLL
jgi:transposase-like protein